MNFIPSNLRLKFIGNECLWNSRVITVSNKTVYCSDNNWDEYEITYTAIYQLYYQLYRNRNPLSSYQLSGKYRLSIKHLHYISIFGATKSNLTKSSYEKSTESVV